MLERLLGGDVRYVDGRDRYAPEALTLAHVNAWTGLPRLEHPVTFQLRHGMRVRVVERRICDGREYSRVLHWFRSGWIPSSFLSDTPESPIGDVYQPAQKNALNSLQAWRRRKDADAT